MIYSSSPDGKHLVHLIGHGEAYAKRADEFQRGEYRMFNYGYVYRITNIAPVGRRLEFTLLNEASGKTHTLKHKPETMLAYHEKAAR